MQVATPNDRPDSVEPDDDDDPHSDADTYAAFAAESRRGSVAHGPGKRASDVCERSFNLAVYKLVHGYKGLYAHLSTITGLSPNALKCRVNEVVATGTPDDDESTGLDADEAKYVELRYGHRHDPATGEWRVIDKPGVRRHPDRRRFRDRDRSPPE